MIVVVDDAGVRLEGQDDFTRFEVVSSVAAQELADRLAASGAGDVTAPDQAAICSAWVQTVAGGSEEWLRRFLLMLEYAAIKGWITDRSILAHIVWSPPHNA